MLEGPCVASRRECAGGGLLASERTTTIARQSLSARGGATIAARCDKGHSLFQTVGLVILHQSGHPSSNGVKLCLTEARLIFSSQQGTQTPLCIGSSSRKQAAHGRSGGADISAEGSKLGCCGISTDTGGVKFAAHGTQIVAQCVGCSFCGTPRRHLCTQAQTSGRALTRNNATAVDLPQPAAVLHNAAAAHAHASSRRAPPPTTPQQRHWLSTPRQGCPAPKQPAQLAQLAQPASRQAETPSQPGRRPQQQQLWSRHGTAAALAAGWPGPKACAPAADSLPSGGRARPAGRRSALQRRRQRGKAATNPQHRGCAQQASCSRAPAMPSPQAAHSMTCPACCIAQRDVKRLALSWQHQAH